jgi:hypothetical protein
MTKSLKRLLINLKKQLEIIDQTNHGIIARSRQTMIQKINLPSNVRVSCMESNLKTSTGKISAELTLAWGIFNV